MKLRLLVCRSVYSFFKELTQYFFEITMNLEGLKS